MQQLDASAGSSEAQLMPIDRGFARALLLELVAAVQASVSGGPGDGAFEHRGKPAHCCGIARTGCLLRMETRLKALMVIATQITAEISSSVRTSRAAA